MESAALLYVSAQVSQGSGPVYLRIVRAIARGVDTGDLRSGVRLPSQRVLAHALGIDFTTVTRAYAEASRRGLVISTRGVGTVVAKVARGLEPVGADAGHTIDLSSVWPPTLRLPLDLSSALTALGGESGVRLFSARHARRDEAALAPAVDWLQPRFTSSIAGRVTASAGARGALLALMRLVVSPGDTLLTESLTWPTVRVLAGLFGIETHGVAMDAEGLLPDALDSAAASTGARALYCVPNAQNPTNASMSATRRLEIVRVAERHGLHIIEDDVYGELMAQRPPPLAEFAPRNTYYIASLSKCLSSSFRVAYVVAPDRAARMELDGLLRHTMLWPAPIEEALAAQTLKNGTARRYIARVRAEASAREAVARKVLVGFDHAATFGPLFLWLRTPVQWNRAALVEALRLQGVLVLASDMFATDPAEAPAAIRVATGSPATQDELREGLRTIVRVLESSPRLATPAC
jgi:DNA-binding transcriptional MocR family regulator